MLMKIGIGFLALLTALMGTAAWAVVQSGVAYVSVDDPSEGVSFHVPVPLVLADAALAFAPEEDLRQARRELQRHAPFLKGALQELAAVEDAVFVHISSPYEEVRVFKKNGYFVVDVQSDRESVHVSVPVEGVQRLMGSVAGW